MSNIQLFNPAQLPAHIKKGELSSVAKALMGGGGASGKRISVKGGVFRLVVNGKEVAAMEERYLDVVVVNAAPKVSRTFYMGTYDEANPAPPTCWSQDGDVPDKSIKAPQAASCATCKQNVAGSGQGQSRACRYSQRLAVVLANDMEGDVLQLSLAATSLFGKAEGDNRPLQDYAKWLAAQGVDPTQLVTRLKFDTKAPVPKLFFKAMRWLEADELVTCAAQGASPDAIQAITMTVSQTDGLAPAVAAPAEFTAPAADEDEPPAPPPKAAKAPKAAKVVEAPADDAEPSVRAPAAKAQDAVPAASGVAKTLAEWDDE